MPQGSNLSSESLQERDTPDTHIKVLQCLAEFGLVQGEGQQKQKTKTALPSSDSIWK